MSATSNPTDARVDRYFEAEDGAVVRAVKVDGLNVTAKVVESGDDHTEGARITTSPSRFDRDFDRIG